MTVMSKRWCFSSSNALSTNFYFNVFNKNTAKVSCSCIDNMEKKIMKKHNQNVLNIGSTSSIPSYLFEGAAQFIHLYQLIERISQNGIVRVCHKDIFPPSLPPQGTHKVLRSVISLGPIPLLRSYVATCWIQFQWTHPSFSLPL